MWFRKPKNPKPADASRNLREQALTITPQEAGISRSGTRRVWSVIMETGYPEAVVTLMTSADGTTSLYFSTGGGVIGGGGHQTVKTAAMRLVESADAFLPSFSPVSEYPSPDKGRVRFYLRTFDGTVSAECDEAALGHGRDPLSPLFHSAHAVITAIRELGLL
jgi:hypothetical protein